MQNYVVIIMWEAFELHELPKSMQLNLVRVTPRKKSHMPTAHGIDVSDRNLALEDLKILLSCRLSFPYSTGAICS